MAIQQSERTVRDVGAKSGKLDERASAIASILANAIFAKKGNVVGVLLGAALVGGAASLPAAELDLPTLDEPANVAGVEGENVAETIYRYQIESNGATIIGVRDRTATTLVIPEKIKGVNVTKIGESAFVGLKNLESLTWKSSAKCEIGARAFGSCPALKRVELPEGLEAIPEYAFISCSSLETISGGKNVRTIGKGAFFSCQSLKTLEFSEVVAVGERAFYGCERLTTFDFVSSENAAFQLVDGLLLSKDGKTLVACPPGRTGEVVVPDGVVSIAKSAFEGGAVESVVLPQTLELIDSKAFEQCSKLKSVVGAPKALETIGAHAFFYCFDLERFDWPENLQVIGNEAFADCDLTSAQIKSVRRVGENAFYNNDKLATVELPSETREIDARAFARTALKSFKLPRGLETLQPGAFAEVALEKIEIEEGNAAFKVVDGALLSADGKTLYFRLPATPETTWKIPDGVRVVARSAFSGNKSLVSLVIPEGVETIGESAFSGCSALQKLTIPASLREFDDKCYGCDSLLTFEVAEGNPNYRSVDGSLVSKDGKTLYRCGGTDLNRRVVPNGVERLAPFSCEGIQSYVEIAPTVKRIDAGAFANSRNLTAIKIPASVERIDERFSNREKLTTFEVAPENPVYKSENGALLSKDGKTFYCLVVKKGVAKTRPVAQREAETEGVEYVVPEGVETIVRDAFMNRDEITNVVFPQSLKKIERYAFMGTYFLTSVAIPAGVTTIEPGAFAGCNLREVVLESSEAKFPPETFARPSYKLFGGEVPVVRVDEKVREREAAELAARKAREEAFLWGRHESGSATITGVRDRNATTLEIPETLDGLPVQAIATEAFVGMSALKTVRIPTSVRTIGAKAFAKCAALEKIEFATPEKSRLYKIDKNAFQGCSSLKTFEAPDMLNEVGVWAFGECSALETVKFGKWAERIGSNAFQNCVSLRNVEFSDDASSPFLFIDYEAFRGCDALVEFNAPKNLSGINAQAFGPLDERSTPIKFNLHPECQALKNVDGLIASADGKRLCAYFGDGSKEVVVPEGAEFLENIFQGSPITAIRLPKSLRQIGAQSFRRCEKLERVEIPEDAALEGIGMNAFYDCKALKTFAWPKSLKTIASGAFRNCESLESFVGATGVEFVGSSAFVDCKALKTIELPNGLLEIDASAFAETGVESIKIPASVRKIGDAALAITPLKTIEVEEGNPSVKVVDGALLSADGTTLWRLPPGLKLKSYKVPDGVQVIERAALGGNATLEEIELPESLTTIKHNAFYRCSPLKKIRIPAKVVDFNVAAFTLCDSLESFEVAPENPKFKSENGALLSKDGKLFYKLIAVERDPSAAPYVLEPMEDGEERREIPAYKNPIYRVPDGVVSIEYGAFNDERGIRNAFTEIVLPDSVANIARAAFQDCRRLETARISANVSKIEPSAFLRCYALKTFEIAPENRMYCVVDGMLFDKLEPKVLDIILDQKRAVWKIPEGVERLSNNWIPPRFDIPEIVLPESLATIESGALSGSRNLTKITIPKNVKEIADGAFHSCPKLEEVVVKSASTKFTKAAFLEFHTNPFEPGTRTSPKLKIRVEGGEKAAQNDAANVDLGTPYEEASKTFDVRIVDGEATILGTRSQEPTLKIPEKIDGAPVTKIAPKAFANNGFVKEIVLPSMLREIGDFAFMNCVSLETISPFPSRLPIHSVALGQFSGCGAIRKFSVDPANPNLSAVDGVLFSKDGAVLYMYPRGRADEVYQVPDGVRRIGDRAFAGNVNIKTVKFSWRLRSIGAGAFSGCRSLESAQFFPVVNMLRTIENDAFRGCDALKSIDLPDGLLVIEQNAFHCRSLETVGFYPVTVDEEEAREALQSENVAGPTPTGMTIEGSAFVTPNLKSFELPETLGELRGGAIKTGMENLRTGVAVDAAERRRDKLVFKLPRNMKGFSPGAFNGAVNLQAFEVDPTDERWSTVDGVLLSKDGKTLYCYPGAKDGLEYDVPEGVETIEAAAFSGSGLHKIRTPKTLRKIAKGAFNGCRSLKTLEIAEGVVEMGGGFNNCSQLETLKLPATLSNDDVFTEGSLASYCYNLKTIEIAPESAAFKNVDGAVLSKDGKTLYWVPGRRGLTEYVAPDGVETIAANAFNGFMRLETIRLPNGLKTIARDAFNGCHKLTTITIPASVVEIDSTAFRASASAKTFNVEAGNATFKVVDGALVKGDGEKVYEPPRTLQLSVPL
ncbi:MAG: leucine-rich repeat domain-containing protein [Thermoguttaceae bacterium]|nr:leucine-rich repeat domain-containing protein [Thermoguttaceae bacterium]